MKKGLAITLLAIGAVLGIFGLAWLAILLTLSLYPVGIILSVVIAAAATFGLDALRRLFKRQYGFSDPNFMLCAYLPSVICAAAYFIWYSAMEGSNRFIGLFAGLGEFIFTLSYSTTAVVMPVLELIFLIVLTNLKKKREETQ